ncbi:uncharacterized protein N7483_012349 [Penicillium malachiteum]|uniref:uncharacterized protein n=1 Tax=Penicillium malachiteum TaxID=1324776 RepID=UPI002548A482|nr:uncharacterized protein N7483_012349 [Penicillium malachiteum]KAJ5715168.1 hypothetical protein N7483_012349 [Penicillium malachiteum]
MHLNFAILSLPFLLPTVSATVCSGYAYAQFTDVSSTGWSYTASDDCTVVASTYSSDSVTVDGTTYSCVSVDTPGTRGTTDNQLSGKSPSLCCN